MSEITKDDLNELKNEITALKELYEKELERETSERDLQVTKDSEQLEISNAEKVAEQEQETTDREAEQTFRTSVTDFFKEYKELNATVETLTAEQTEQERTEQGQFQMNVLVGLWLVVFVIIASNISNIFFNRMLRSWN